MMTMIMMMVTTMRQGIINKIKTRQDKARQFKGIKKAGLRISIQYPPISFLYFNFFLIFVYDAKC